MLDSSGQVQDRRVRRPHRICPVSITHEEQPDDEFAQALQNNRRTLAVQSNSGSATADRGRAEGDRRGIFSTIGVMTTAAAQKLDPETSARRWGIGIKAARETIKRTTQRGMRSVSHASLSRRFRPNDRQMRCRRLPVELCTDTLVTSCKSRRGNKYAQIFYAKEWLEARISYGTEGPSS